MSSGFDDDDLDLETNEEINKPTIVDNSNGSIPHVVLGIGQGGSNIAMALKQLGYIVGLFNTSDKDLKIHTHEYKLHVKVDNTDDGSAKTPEHSRLAFEQNEIQIKTLIRKLFESNPQRVIICGTSSGGCGAGGIIPMIDYVKSIFHEKDLKDINERITVITTLPKNIEINAPKIKNNVNTLINQLSNMADEKEIGSLLIINNNKLNDLFKGTKRSELFPKTNSHVAELYNIFNRASSMSSDLSNLDTADYKSILSCGGHLSLSKVRIPGNVIMKDIDNEDVLQEYYWDKVKDSIIVNEYNPKNAKLVGCVLVGNESLIDELTDDQFERLYITIGSLYSDAVVYRGEYSKPDKANVDPDPNKASLSIYTIVGGLPIPEKVYEKYK